MGRGNNAAKKNGKARADFTFKHNKIRTIKVLLGNTRI